VFCILQIATYSPWLNRNPDESLSGQAGGDVGFKVLQIVKTQKGRTIDCDVWPPIDFLYFCWKVRFPLLQHQFPSK